MTQVSTLQDGIVSISGDLTFTTVTALCQAIPKYFTATQDVAVDLSAVKNCDSASLVLLVSITRFFVAKNKTVTFIHLPQSMLTLVELYNLQQLIVIKKDE